ncbi:MAG TPA: tRNA (adenosine(37)-N6)-dimethylallyltransferase MiaA, partial [Steroidobacteraceae bacterium]|nr:tRNA (adenosine(37)-N6)-dimethylallyltransferase MiaA [Steroidobacteraceae bacterium]
MSSTGRVAAAASLQLPVYLLTGPTGTGKSDWAIRLAEVAPVEIVSVDSAMVYRGLDIGTAKPARELRSRLPHHLVDICDPAESYSAGRFVTDAMAAITAAHARRRVPLLVGGTMLYLRALLKGLAPLPQASEPLRGQIEERAARSGWPALHAELARLDPEAAARINRNDSQRIQRALEVCLASGRPLSELQRATVSPLAGIPLKSWALAPRDRPMLHQRLASRFHAMMAAGFLDEVRALHGRGDLT